MIAHTDGRVINRRLLILFFGILLIAALGVRLLTFDRYLPYLDYGDESNPYLLGRDWRGVEDVPYVPEWLAGYPPLYVWMNILVQQAVEAGSPSGTLWASDYIHALRLIAAFVSGFTVLLVASIGWLIGGRVAAGFAGVVWAFSPYVVELGSLAIPDPLVYTACAAAIAAALWAWQKQSLPLLTCSLIAGIAAVYLKYPALYALLPWAIVTAIMIRRSPKNLWRWLALQAVIAGGLALYLAFIYGALQLSNREANTFRSDGLQFMLDLERNLNNWQFAILPVGVALFFGVVLIAALAYFYNRRRGGRVLDLKPLALLLVYSFVGIVISAGFSHVGLDAGKMRHTLPMTVALIPIWAGGIAQIAWALQTWAMSHPETKWWKAAAPASLLLIGAIAVVPFVLADARLIETFNRVDTHALLWQWTDANLPLPPEGLILAHPESDVAHTWNRPWSGYNGYGFNWWHETPFQGDPANYVERGIAYLVMSDSDRDRFYNTPEAQAFIDQLTLLKIVPATPQTVGPTAYFYRMLPPQFAADATFGEQITLAGYDLNGTTFAPGDTIHLRPYWRIAQRPTANYSMLLHLYPADRIEIVAQEDGPPTTSARLTLTWDDPQELYMGRDGTLTIPAETPPGEYRVVVGLYDFDSGVRLLDENGLYYFAIPITIRGG